MQPLQLSKADSKVLAQVFDPESGPAKPEVVVDPSLPADRHIKDATLIASLRTREKEAVRLIETYEKSQVTDREQKNTVFTEALAILDKLANEHPGYASVRNNRAQLRRWYWGDRNLLCGGGNSSQERKAAARATLADLKHSIALASPAKPTDAVSSAQGRLLAQAHTQLGAVYLAAAKDLGSSHAEEDPVEVVDESLRDWSSDRFEEEASRMFFLGGLYGNEVAKALAVHTNPQAKLCGSIVKEAMRKELSMAI